MIRLDKYLCDAGIGTRSEVKKLLKKRLVQVNGQIIIDGSQKINELNDSVFYQNKEIAYSKYIYIMLHKPAGYITATKDKTEKTVMDLCKDLPYKDLVPVGRLDKDTEGLLLLTNDGGLAHELLSPKKHVVKTYYVKIQHPLSAEDIFALEEGVDIGDDKITKPAKVIIQSESEILLSITEGRFHQIKRMLHAVDNEVCYLKRLSMGSLKLDDSLNPGQYRYLTSEEVLGLQSRHPSLHDIDAVIFDVDGTMVDSMWMWRRIDKEYLERFHIALPDDLQKNIEGMSFTETAQYFKNTFHIPDSIDEIMSSWNEMAMDKYRNEVPLKEGVLEFLELCKSKNIKLGIATSNSTELINIICKTHNLTDYISCIKTGSEVTHGKPAPDIYLAVAKDLHVEPARCLVFEDIPAGIIAGKSAGMKVCAVLDAYSMDSDAQKHLLADYYIEKFSLILEHFTHDFT